MKTKLIGFISSLVIILSMGITTSCEKDDGTLKTLEGTTWIGTLGGADHVTLSFQQTTFSMMEIDDGFVEGMVTGTYTFSYPTVSLIYRYDGATEYMTGVFSGNNTLALGEMLLIKQQ